MAEQPGWYWCPRHLLAAPHPGICGACGRAYEPAPPGGLPPGPYRPAATARRRTTREVSVSAIAVLLGVATLAGAAVGLTLLYQRGTPLDSQGQPQVPEASVSIGGGGAAASSNVPLRTFDGRTLTLPGQWSTTATYPDSMRNVAQIFASGSTLPTLDVAVSHGSTTVAVFSVATTSASADVAALVATPGGSRTLADGSTETYSDASAMRIAGHDAVGRTLVTRTASGTLRGTVRFYAVADGDHLELIEVGTTETGAPEMPAAQTAVEGL